jgi:hypothetical protein
MSDRLEVTDAGQSVSWVNASVPWALVELQPDAQVTTGSMNLSGEITTFGDTVTAELVDSKPVRPRGKATGRVRAG